jgi:uncharacterized phiE125 gp8 family phage protein
VRTAEHDAWLARRRSERVLVDGVGDPIAIGDVIALDEAKAHLRREGLSDDDGVIEALIRAAVDHVEMDTGRALLTQTWRTWFDAVPVGGVLLLERGRVQSVTSIVAYDPDDAETTVATTVYFADRVSEPARVVLKDGQSWPTDLRTTNALAVNYTAGYGTTASTIPGPLKQATLLVLGAMYEHREQVIVAQFAGQFLLLPFGYDQLVSPYRVWLA